MKWNISHGQFLKKHVLPSMLNLPLLLINQTIFKHDFIMNYLKNVFQKLQTGTSEDNDWVWGLLVKINVFFNEKILVMRFPTYVKFS